MTTSALTILILANTPIFFGLAWLIFRTWENFFDAIRFWFTPDAWSFIQGEFLADWYAEAYALEKLLTQT